MVFPDPHFFSENNRLGSLRLQLPPYFALFMFLLLCSFFFLGGGGVELAFLAPFACCLFLPVVPFVGFPGFAPGLGLGLRQISGNGWREPGCRTRCGRLPNGWVTYLLKTQLLGGNMGGKVIWGVTCATCLFNFLGVTWANMSVKDELPQGLEF